MEYDVTKMQFSQKIIYGFFRNFAERRQIDAREGTNSFASISGVVFELSRKSGSAGGGPPISGARVKAENKYLIRLIVLVNPNPAASALRFSAFQGADRPSSHLVP